MRFLLFGGLLLAFAGCGQQSAPASDVPIAQGTVIRDGPVGAQHGDFNLVPAPADEFGEWQKLTVEGISFELPSGEAWRIDLVEDPCSDRFERWIIMEHKASGDRIRIQFLDREIDATFVGEDVAKLDNLIARVEKSFSGDRRLSANAQAMIPVPTIPSCDRRSDEVPTLVPLPTAQKGQTEVAVPTITPVSDPKPE